MRRRLAIRATVLQADVNDAFALSGRWTTFSAYSQGVALGCALVALSGRQRIALGIGRITEEPFFSGIAADGSEIAADFSKNAAIFFVIAAIFKLTAADIAQAAAAFRPAAAEKAAEPTAPAQ